MKKIWLLMFVTTLLGCDFFAYNTGNSNTEEEEGSLNLSGIDPSGEGGEVLSAAEACFLPKMVGPCEGAFSAFYFDDEEGECLPFVYGGCDGNDNRFDTLEECEAACPSNTEGETVSSNDGIAEAGGETSEANSGWESSGDESGDEVGETSGAEGGGETSGTGEGSGMGEAGEGGESAVPDGVDPACYLECIEAGGLEDTCLGLCRLESSGEEGDPEEGGSEEGEELEFPDGVDPECYAECMASGEPQDYCFGLCRIGPEEEGGENPNPESGYPFGTLVCAMAGSGLGVGAASYHFISPTENYISYENAPPQWFMDNGQKLTPQKYFVEETWNAENRIFTGNINWNEPEGTSVSGTNYWEYELQFSQDYGYIQAGSVNTYFGFALFDTLYYPDDYYYECFTP